MFTENKCLLKIVFRRNKIFYTVNTANAKDEAWKRGSVLSVRITEIETQIRQANLVPSANSLF